MHMYIAVGRAEDASQKPVLSSSWEIRVGVQYLQSRVLGGRNNVILRHRMTH